MDRRKTTNRTGRTGNHAKMGTLNSSSNNFASWASP